MPTLPVEGSSDAPAPLTKPRAGSSLKYNIHLGLIRPVVVPEWAQQDEFVTFNERDSHTKAGSMLGLWDDSHVASSRWRVC